MIRLFAPVIAFALAAVAVAAPVPKVVKKRPTSPDGTWELAEFHSNGVKQDHTHMTKVWQLDGETFHIGPKGQGSVWSLTTPDPDKPTLRRFVPSGGGTGYPAAVEADGDELRFCYGGNQNDAVTECKPAANVFYYVFKRVSADGK